LSMTLQKMCQWRGELTGELSTIQAYA
jgi:hypothetical protein